MELVSHRDVIARCPRNPLIRLEDVPFRCSDIRNAAVVSHAGEHLLLVTVELLEGRCAVFRARRNGGGRFAVDPRPFMAPDDDGPGRAYESTGIGDPRVTRLDGTYYIVYVAEGDHGQRLGLARTADFETVERLGYVSQVDVKNGVLFPRRIGGKYMLLQRPQQGWRIWLAGSEDLTFWHCEAVVMTPRGGFWDPDRIGAAAPPIEIDEGWLLIYYGERSTSAGPLVRLGAAILDRDDPSRVLARSNIPILSPRERYERIGDVPNVVFSCGALLEGDTVHLYYGASDSCICRGEAPLEAVVRTCFDSERGF